MRRHCRKEVDVRLNASMACAESLQVHNTVLLDEGCALGERDLQTVACVRRSWRSGHKEREESQNSSELHLHCEEKIGGLWTNEVEWGSEGKE